MSYGFPFVEKGNKKGRTIVFMAGFPDEQMSGWGPKIPEELGEEYRLVFLCLPGYDDPEKIRKWGYDFPELIFMMHSTLEKLQIIQESEKFFLVGHDWGSFIALMYQNQFPQYVERFIQLDVAITKGSDTTKDAVIKIFYQAYFGLSYFVSQTFGKPFGKAMFGLFLNVFMPSFGPILPSETLPRKLVPSMVDMCYPYYYAWKRILTSSMMRFKFPTCPTLFLYGTRKRCMFHDQRYLKRIDSTVGCRRKSVDGGHWFMVTCPDVVIEEIKTFIKT